MTNYEHFSLLRKVRKKQKKKSCSRFSPRPLAELKMNLPKRKKAIKTSNFNKNWKMTFKISLSFVCIKF